MADERCANCGEATRETFELLIRSRSHEDVPLCQTCHEAIQAELSE